MCEKWLKTHVSHQNRVRMQGEMPYVDRMLPLWHKFAGVTRGGKLHAVVRSLTSHPMRSGDDRYSTRQHRHIVFGRRPTRGLIIQSQSCKSTEWQLRATSRDAEVQLWFLTFSTRLLQLSQESQADSLM